MFSRWYLDDAAMRFEILNNRCKYQAKRELNHFIVKNHTQTSHHRFHVNFIPVYKKEWP